MIQKFVSKRKAAKSDRIRQNEWFGEQEARMEQILAELRSSNANINAEIG
jgi:hypothetical protein